VTDPRGRARAPFRPAVKTTRTESSLVSRLEQVADRRRRRGLRHPLLVVLVQTACA